MFIALLYILLSIAAGADQIAVPGGKYEPLYKDKGEPEIIIDNLLVDKTPVTNKEFLSFVKTQPSWQKSKIKSLFADETYLHHWSGDLSFPEEIIQQPVTYVSWFAARAYCNFHGKRLPTIAEWEHLSDAENPELKDQILKWYSTPSSQLNPVGQGTPNKYGVHDTYGLVWEWVDDFSSTIMASDSRGGNLSDMFCGGASLGSKDPSLYATFLRYAFRSSLKASYGTSSLGFRCVQTDTKADSN